MSITVLSDGRVPPGIVLVNPRVLCRAPETRVTESGNGIRIETTLYAPAVLADAVLTGWEQT